MTSILGSYEIFKSYQKNELKEEETNALTIDYVPPKALFTIKCAGSRNSAPQTASPAGEGGGQMLKRGSGHKTLEDP
jgi:hypothetical protein